MGLGGIHIGSLLLILLIVVLIFGVKRLRNVGGDLGTAIREFRKSLNHDNKVEAEETASIQHTHQHSDKNTGNKTS